MTVLRDTPGAGHFLLSEASGYRSRQRIVVPLGVAALSGQVLGKVTAGGQYVPLAPAAADGSQTAAGVLFADVLASDQPTDAVSIERDAEVVLAKLVWPTGITENQKTAAVAALAAKGVLARF